MSYGLGPDTPEVFSRAELEFAIRSQQMIVHYQPIFDLPVGHIVGFEALVRWMHPAQGLMLPDRFIPLIEDFGLIVGLGNKMLQTATAQLGRWIRLRRPPHPIFVSVNLAAEHFSAKHSLLEKVHDALKSSALSAHHLVLEITERTSVRGEVCIETLQRLRHSGIRLALDDFDGEEEQTFLLGSLPLDIVKMDKQLLHLSGDVGGKVGRLECLVADARARGMDVVVEGVESESHLLRSASLRCWGQGFYLGRPGALG